MWAPLSTAQPAPQTLLPVISPATPVGKGRQNSPRWGQKDGFTTSAESKQAAEFITAPWECCNLRTFFPCMGVSHFSVKHFVLKWVQLLYIRAFSMKSWTWRERAWTVSGCFFLIPASWAPTVSIPFSSTLPRDRRHWLPGTSRGVWQRAFTDTEPVPGERPCLKCAGHTSHLHLLGCRIRSDECNCPRYVGFTSLFITPKLSSM